MTAIQLKLNAANTYQTIEGFGASGAWWAQLVGGWPEETRREIMRLLYDNEQGLGMQIFRYNLGGGSRDSGKGHYWCPRRRTAEYHDDAEAVWCMNEAVRLGADEIVLFANSPPERMTKSGMAQAKTAFRANLKRKHERDFARYILDATEHFLAQDLPVKFISPINEPLGPWSGKLSGQEGCHYHPRGLRRLLRVVAQEMNTRPALQQVYLSGTEINDLRMLSKTYARKMLGDKVVRSRVDGIDVHGYVFKPLAWQKGADVKRRFRKWMDKKYPGQVIRMTEWTEMQGGRDYGMDSALTLANEVWEDLTITGVVSWQTWIAVSEYDYSDGLIYIDSDKQSFDLPKRYYAYGHFTKFVPRGAVRVEVSGVPDGLQAVAFKCDTHTAVILINRTQASMEVSLGKGEAALYETNETKSLFNSTAKLENIQITAKSVNTVVIAAQ